MQAWKNAQQSKRQTHIYVYWLQSLITICLDKSYVLGFANLVWCITKYVQSSYVKITLLKPNLVCVSIKYILLMDYLA